MKSSNAGRGDIIIWYFTVMKYGTTKKTFTDVLIKQADTKAKEFKTIMLPVNCFDTEL